jgi:hypothetical protein
MEPDVYWRVFTKGLVNLEVVTHQTGQMVYHIKLNRAKWPVLWAACPT